MAMISPRIYILFIFIFSDSLSPATVHSVGVGINYGRISDNIPAPPRVATLLSSLNISRVKLYDSDPTVLSAFANSNTDFIVGLVNGDLQRVTDPAQALAWVQQNVVAHIPQTKIGCITVGNEILTGDNADFKSNLLPAMQNIQRALHTLGLSGSISVTTAHSYDVLSNSYPPSSGTFRSDIAEYIQNILKFHSENKSPFMINAYPFFAYMADPAHVSLPYALFEPNPGMVDPGSSLRYDNMLYAQIDAVYSAIKAMGFSDIPVKVSETGWPSKGGPDEVGATVENARLYNANLVSRIGKNEATPGKPSVPIDIYVFALFNENLKTGPLSERNYGLYYPDGTPVYNLGLQAYLPRMHYSHSWRYVILFLNLFLPVVLSICYL